MFSQHACSASAALAAPGLLHQGLVYKQTKAVYTSNYDDRCDACAVVRSQGAPV
jgi:hypothetical protein